MLKITDRSEIDQFLKEINNKNYAPISSNKEIELSNKIKKGDHKAKIQLVNANLRFIVNVAKQYQNPYVQLADLINEGVIGMLEAAELFDSSRGFKFITFAVIYVKKSIYNFMIENGKTVRMPANIINDMNKAKKDVHKIEQSEKRNVDYSEVYDNSEYFTQNPSSIDKPISDDNSNTFINVYENSNAEKADENTKNNDIKIMINDALNILTSREKIIIKSLYGIDNDYPKVIDEVANDLNLSKERVRQIKEKALKRIRFSSKNKILKEYC